MKTKLVIAAALLVCGVSSLALAQEKSLEEIDKRTNRIFQTEGIQQEQYTRVVPSGTKQRIQYYYASNPDCTASGDVIVRITKEPEHGKIEVIPETKFANFKKDNVRAKCNEQKVRTQVIYYKSADKYVGDDELELLILFPGGFAWEHHYKLSVR